MIELDYHMMEGYHDIHDPIPNELSMRSLSRERAVNCLNNVIDRLACTREYYPKYTDFFPQVDRFNILLVGLYKVHDRIGLYHSRKDLKTLIEGFVTGQNTCIEIVALQSQTTFFAVETKSFCYKQIDYIYERAYTQDFFILLREKDIFLYFNEDQPFAYVSFPNRDAAKEWFATPEQMKEIYLKNYKDWRIWDSKEADAYVEKVNAHFYP